MAYAESTAESAALTHLGHVGFAVHSGPDVAPSGPTPLRTDYSQVVLPDRLHQSLAVLNPTLGDAVSEVEKKLLRLEGTTTIERNRTLQGYLLHGVPVEVKRADGQRQTVYAKVIDPQCPHLHDLVAVSQFLVKDKGTGKTDKPDIVLFINGLPLVLIELKDPGDVQADWVRAYKQIERYKLEIPSLFDYNALCIASDGLVARVGSLTADVSRFAPWRTVDGVNINPKGLPELETLIRGMLTPAVLLELAREFAFFEDVRKTNPDGSSRTETIKKVAGYHQYHAVKKAVTSIADAVKQAEPPRRGGVVWHTQGSGKSISMLMLAGQLIRHPVMENPTLVVVTDRNDLDGQLFDQFAAGRELLGTTPVKADNRADLKKLLNTTAGGVIFTTMQKFDESQEKISERANVVVLADEAHRTQYGFQDGFAAKLKAALPNAVKVGFTGTPVSSADKNTRNVFGGYVDVYDIQRAVEDGATVPIYYEHRLVNLNVDPKADLDGMYNKALEAMSLKPENVRGRVELEDLVGTDARMKSVAKVIVDHWEARENVLNGKAMIVCMSRLIAAKLYDEIITLRPTWHNADDRKGKIKVVMTGSSNEPAPLNKHARTDKGRSDLADWFKDPGSPFQIAIVCDMWLTGFDVPCLHTMYLDKPLAGHTLMQAIARVNRVYKEKPSGLIVDLLGIAPALQAALKEYAQYDPNTQPMIDQSAILPVLEEKFALTKGFFHDFDYQPFFGNDDAEKEKAVKNGADYVLTLPDGKKRFLTACAALGKAFAIAVPLKQTEAVAKDLGYFQQVVACFRKLDREAADPTGEIRATPDDSAAIKQVIDSALVSGGVIDVLKFAGIQSSSVSVLDEKFLASLKAMPQRNLALEVMRKLLNDQIQSLGRTNLVQSRKFNESLQEALNRYRNRPLEVAEVLQELVNIAKAIKAEPNRAAELKLTELELAFYDALAEARNVQELIKSGELRSLAVELTQRIRDRADIDWTMKDSVRAEMRAIVKRLLRKYKYPPEIADKAADTVMEQAERMAATLTEAT